MAIKSVRNENGEWKFTTIIRINSSISIKYDFNRTTRQHLLLYIFYVLQISLLWTNCVISTVAAVQNFEMKRHDKTHDLLQYQSNESNMYSNLKNRTEDSLRNQSMENGFSINQFDSIKFLNSNLSETTTRNLSMDSKTFLKNRMEQSRKLKKSNYLKHLTLSPTQISLNSSITKNERNHVQIKKIARKNVIHNLLFRNKIKRNVNNSSTYLLFNSSFNDENVSILSISSTPETFSTAPSLSSNSNNNSLNASNEIDTAITNQTTPIIIATLSNVTLEIIRNKTNSNEINNHMIIKPSTTKQPPNYQQLNRYKVNNVFEMARRLKYNKLLTRNLSGPNESSSSSSSSIDISNSSDSNNTNTKGTVSVLGLFELSTRHGVRPEGYSELAAAQMAVRHINQRGLLPGYTLQLLTNDTKVRFPFIFAFNFAFILIFLGIKYIETSRGTLLLFS